MTDFVRFNPALSLALMFGGGIESIMVILIYPYYKPIDPPTVADREMIDLSQNNPSNECYEKVRFQIPSVWMVPIIVFFL